MPAGSRRSPRPMPTQRPRRSRRPSTASPSRRTASRSPLQVPRTSRPRPPARPPPPPAVFGGVSPSDGVRLFFLEQIILRATTIAHWTNVSVTPDGGSAQTFPDADTATYTIPYTPPGAGGYTIHATMTDTRYDSFTPVEVASHFDYGPPPPPPTTGSGNAGPNQPG